MLEPTVDLKPWFTVLKDHSAPVQWEDIFPSPQPIEIDVGCGRGLFLWNASQKQPQKNFLGIEIDMKEGRRGALRLKKLNQPNACVWGGDVNIAFEKYVLPGTISAVHLYFPDPWWKHRHHKRRVFNERFLHQVEQVLITGGEFHLWTDVTAYWRNAATTVRGDFRFEELAPPEENQPEHEMDYQTSYEKKKRRDGWPIYRGRWRKK